MTRYVRLTRYVKLSVYKHDRAQSGTTHSGSVYGVTFAKSLLNFCLRVVLK